MKDFLATLFFVTSFILFATPMKASPPKVAPKNPWFTTDPNLTTKEATLEASTSTLVTPTGLLLYRAVLPWADTEKYQVSHNVADLPAWHGYLMAAYAFKEAVTGQDMDAKIAHLTDGFLSYYQVTGIPGLIGRSIMPDYTGKRLPWMSTAEDRPTRFWLQGPNKQWWRNGVAKGHLNLAAFGAAIPLALDRRGDIKLSETTKQKLISFLVPLVKRLYENDFKYPDWNGKTTEYGNLGPQCLNGFNQLVVLHMLRSASFYDSGAMETYKTYIKKWPTTIAWSMQILGYAITQFVGKKRGKDFDKPSFSDMQVFGLAYTSMFLQENNREYMKNIRRGMKGLWAFVQYERNPMFSIPYVATIRQKETHRMDEVIEDLRDFPIEKYAADTGKRDTSHIQPLANRPLNTNYWKSNPFRAIRYLPPSPRTGEEKVYAGMDYMLAYWMGRYFKVVPAQ